MKEYKINIDLINAIQNDNLLVFVGAGLSKNYEFPSWKELVFDILNQLSIDDKKYEGLKKVLEENIFSEIEILDRLLIMNPGNRGRVYEVLESSINRNIIDLDLSIPKKIGNVCSKIITTNYDMILENALPNFKKIVHDDTFHLARLPDYKEYIFKIHGCIEKPESCVLFRDDYKALYTTTAAIDRLKSIISDKTILFIGFSFNDEYVKETFKYICDVYNNFNKTHYILTTEHVDFSDYNLMPISIDSWKELPEFLDFLMEKKENSLLPQITNEIVKKKDPQLALVEDSVFKIAILYCNPIDSDPYYNLDDLLKYFNKFNINIDCYHLTEENLNELESYNYLFIFTKEIQKRIIIEDEYFRKKTITIKRLEDQLAILKPDGIFLFLDKVTDLTDSESLSYPIAVVQYEGNLNNLLFKLFKKIELDNLSNSIIYNRSSFFVTSVNKGKGLVKNKNYGNHISNNIEKKNLINFVGRKIDITDIIRKIIVSRQDKIVTIKGSGGIGKTSTVKKIALEFYERGLFKDGIDFIDCEFVKDYKTFEKNIARTFNLEGSIDFVEHISNYENKSDSLIILDNFEPLLYLEDIEKMKNLITFISDYKTVIITSREWIGFEFEEMHELRNFTSEEAEALFERLYPSMLKEDDRKILKEDILEKLLNNNPLAIKIVTQNLPKFIRMDALREELKEDFFRATNTGYIDIFDKKVDGNIERSVSLYQSIYYSYKRLTPREQLGFELLSLFPNGIHMESFKDFFKTDEFKTDIYKITNKEIRSLENKSLIEINGGFISLQSIIGRFAEFHFNKRSEEEKYKYYKRAYAFNRYLLEILDERFDEYRVESLSVFDKNEDNFLKSLDYLEKLNYENKDYIFYIETLTKYYHGIGQLKKFRMKLTKFDKLFQGVTNGPLLRDILIAYLKYYEGDFEAAFNFLISEISVESLDNIEPDTDPFIKKIIISYALHLYALEGYEYQVIEFYIKNSNYARGQIYSILFKLGAYKAVEEYTRKEDFFQFEVKLNTGKINLEELESYIEAGIYNKQYIELMQTNYIKTKLGMINSEVIDKLVVTNPYTMGIKALMLALIEEDVTYKSTLFENAIDKLTHIKYYYVEAIYFYCEFLKEKDLEQFTYWYDLGKGLSEKYHYYYHLHRFNTLISELDFIEYDEEIYLSLIKNEINQLVDENNKDKFVLVE
ncbi:SIR2 family protein [Lysinibacillus sp. TE18511]